jgi:hypothetical protein
MHRMMVSSSRWKTPEPGSRPAPATASLIQCSSPNPTNWGWACQSHVRSLPPTKAGYRRRPVIRSAQSSKSSCRRNVASGASSVARRPLTTAHSRCRIADGKRRRAAKPRSAGFEWQHVGAQLSLDRRIVCCSLGRDHGVRGQISGD